MTLLDLAKQKFSARNLTAAEENLFIATESGDVASSLTGDAKQDDRAAAKDWPASRSIHPECLVWLCTNREAAALVTYSGIRMYGMKIEGDLDLGKIQITFPLLAQNCLFGEYFVLRNARLPSLSLLDCSMKRLHCDDVQVEGDVVIIESRVEGMITFGGAIIGGSLICHGTNIYPASLDRTALYAVDIKVGAGVSCVDFAAKGEVNFRRATIAGDFNCRGARLGSGGDLALSIEGARISGSVILRGAFEADGSVTALGSKVGNYFIWADVRLTMHTALNLRLATVDTLSDDEKSWPAEGKLFLDGFTYDRIDDKAPTDAKRRIQWLQRQPRDRFFAQPYEQLSLVLRKMGRDKDARQVFLSKNPDRARHTRLFSQEWWWYNVFGKLIGYGYMPGRAFCISLGIIVLGSLLFQQGYTRDIISPAKEGGYLKNATGQVVLENGRHMFSEDYPKFNSFIYSLESFTPLLKLDQSENWTPNANRGQRPQFGPVRLPPTGSLLRMYLWFHIMAGWVLTSLWIGALTGLAKKS